MQNIDVDEQAAKDDEDFDSHYSSLSKDSFNATLSSIDEEISPIKFPLRTPVESASSSTVQKQKENFLNVLLLQLNTYVMPLRLVRQMN